jgi:hypothetical protein
MEDFNYSEDEKWRIGALFDKYCSLKISHRAKMSVEFRCSRKNIMVYLAKVFEGKIYRVINTYAMTFSGGKIPLIHKNLSNYCIINKPKLDFLHEKRLTKPTFTSFQQKEAEEYRLKIRGEFSLIKDGHPDENSPVAYKIQFLDDVASFGGVKSKDKKGNIKTFFYYSKSVQEKGSAEKIKRIIEGGTIAGYKDRASCILRLSKQETLDLARKILPFSLERDFYEAFIGGCENLNDTTYTDKIKQIKEIPLDRSIITGMTQEEKINKSITDRADLKALKQEILDKARAEKELKIRLEKQTRLAARQKRAEERARELKVLVSVKEREKREKKEARRAKRLAQHETDILNGFKICKKCEETKPLMAYTLTSYGYMPTCKQCYYRGNKESVKAYVKKYQQENREKLRGYYKMRSSMPVNRMKASMKNRLKALFFRKGDTKTAEIIGLPLKEFKTYMESQFKPTMSWGNYGETWDVDHHIPCRAFDHTNREHALRCWNYKNLRPEFKTENYTKHDKMSNGLSARAMIEGDPKLFAEVRNQMLREIGLPEIHEDAAPPTPIPLNFLEFQPA